MTSSRPVLVVIGPSASGKSSLVRTLFDWGSIRVHPTWTTRPRRLEEQLGSLEHRFVTEAGFDRLVEHDFFADTVTMFGLPHRYGLPHIEPANSGPLDVVMLRAPLVGRFRDLVPDLLVYHVEDTEEQTRSRLLEHGGDPAETKARLADNLWERHAGRLIADRVFCASGAINALAMRVAQALATDLDRVPAHR